MKRKTLYFCTRFPKGSEFLRRLRRRSGRETGERGERSERGPFEKKIEKVLGGTGKGITFATRFREGDDSRDAGEVL